MQATIVEKWRVGFDHKNGFAILMLEFQGKPSVPIAIPIPEVEKIGRALLNMNTEGVSSPAKPN